MKLLDPRRVETHELGHAAVAVRLGFTVTRITVRASSGETVSRPGLDMLDRPVADIAADRVVIALAGPLLSPGRDGQSDADVHRAQEIADAFGLDLGELSDRALRILREPETIELMNAIGSRLRESSTILNLTAEPMEAVT